jgi:hypothetical protein
VSIAVRVFVNAVFGVIFVAGLVLVWAGLDGLVFGGHGIARALFYLAAGFGLWAGLGGIQGVSEDRHHVGGSR